MIIENGEQLGNSKDRAKPPHDFLWCSEARAVLRRIDERSHHLCIDKVAVEVQLGKPERKATIVRIAQHGTKVFHLAKRWVNKAVINRPPVRGVKSQASPCRRLRPIYYLEQHA